MLFIAFSVDHKFHVTDIFFLRAQNSGKYCYVTGSGIRKNVSIFQWSRVGSIRDKSPATQRFYFF